MKGDLNLKDREYFTLLSTLCQELDRNGIRYFIFGGAAAQIEIASTITESGKRDFRKESGLEEHLRKTGDIDLFINCPIDQLIPLFNHICAYLSSRHPNIPCAADQNAIRFGKATANYATLPTELKGFENQLDDILCDVQERPISAGNKTYHFSIESPEYNIAAKLTGNKIKPKDVFDIRHLVYVLSQKGKGIDEMKLKKILQNIGKPTAFDTYKNIASSQEG